MLPRFGSVSKRDLPHQWSVVDSYSRCQGLLIE